MFSGAHLHGQCDRTAAPPIAPGVARVEVVQITRRSFVTSNDVCEIPQIDTGAVDGGNQHVTNLAFALELTRGIEIYVFSLDVNLPARRGDVAAFEYVLEIA